MGATEDIEQAIAEAGSVRDALNIALTRQAQLRTELETAEIQLQQDTDIISEMRQDLATRGTECNELAVALKRAWIALCRCNIMSSEP